MCTMVGTHHCILTSRWDNCRYCGRKGTDLLPTASASNSVLRFMKLRSASKLVQITVVVLNHLNVKGKGRIRYATIDFSELKCDERIHVCSWWDEERNRKTNKKRLRVFLCSSLRTRPPFYERKKIKDFRTKFENICKDLFLKNENFTISTKSRKLNLEKNSYRI